MRDRDKSGARKGKKSKLRCEKCGNNTFTDIIETSLFLSLACSRCGERTLILPQDLELYFPSGTGLEG